MDILNLFKIYLIRKGSSKVTAKNYVSDIRRFISWFGESFGREFHAAELTPDVITLFEKTHANKIATSAINPRSSSQRSVERYLSSLRKFAKFLVEQKLIDTNPFDVLNTKYEILNTKMDPWHIREFKDYLYVFGSSALTIKNYLVDIHAFTTWAERTLEMDPNVSKDNISRIDNSLIEEYKDRLVNALGLSPKTVNRKLSSIRKYLTFAQAQGLIKEFPIPNSQFQISKNEEGISLDDLKESEEKIINQKSSIINRRYSPLPPVRLLQRLFVPYELLEDRVASKIAAFVRNWRLSLRASRFLKLRTTNYELRTTRNIPKEIYAPHEISLKGFSWHQKAYHHLRFTRPNWYKRYHNYAFTHYLHFAILVIYASAVGFIIYTNLFAEPKGNLALAAPTAPPRILSFQGRLTDQNDNPITTATDIRFQVYDDLTATGSGNLLWQEVVEVTPDQDGIFSELLGNGSTCSGQPLTVQQTRCAITSSVFTDNATLYLGITIESTAELTPRQQLATVAYAANSESLQGMLPITDAAVTDNVNTILALDSSGNLTMDGATTPTFQATGGQFKISGQPLLLTTNTGSNSNVQIVPDNLGKIDVQKPLINTSATGNLVPGGVEINDKFGVLATESAVAAFVINNNTTGGDIFTASSSGTTRMTLSNAGVLSLVGGQTADITSLGNANLILSAGGTGDLRLLSDADTDILLPYSDFTGKNAVLYGAETSGKLSAATTASSSFCLVSGASAPSWTSCSSVSGDDWDVAGGAIFPKLASTLDLLLGSTATSSAEFAITGINDGTPTATISATTNGNGLSLTGSTATIQSLRMNTLTIGGSTTGNVVIDSGSSSITLSDATTLSSTLSVGGLATFTAVPTGTGVSQGSVYINPASATADYTLFGAAVGGAEKMRLDEDGDLTTTGRMAIMNAGIQPWAGFYSSYTETNPGVTNPVGFFGRVYIANTVSAWDNRIIGTSGEAHLASTNTQNITPAIGMIGVNGIAFADSGGSGTITGAASFYAGWPDGNNVQAGTFTNYYQYYAKNPGTAGGGSIGTLYGLYLESMTSGSTDNYAIYSAGGKSYFAGNVGIGTTAPVGALEVNKQQVGKALVIFDQDGTDDILAASASGTTKLRILNDGTIRAPAYYDIDNTAYFLDPAATAVSLQLAGDASASGSLVFDGSNKSIDILNGSRLDFQTSPGGDAGLTARMTILNNGNIGIGTATPQELLHTSTGAVTNAHYNTTDSNVIFEGGDSSLQILSNDGGNWASNLFLTSAPSSGDNKHWALSHRGSGLSDRFDLSYITTSSGGDITSGTVTNVLTALTSGNVGIGATAPTAALHIATSVTETAGVRLIPTVTSSGAATGLTMGNSLTLNPANSTNATAQYIAPTVVADTGETVSNFYGIQIGPPVKSGSGTITNAYQGYIQASTIATNNWSLYVEGGTSYLGGNVGIKNTTPLTELDVTGSASLSANLSLRGAATAHTFNILDNGTLNFTTSEGGDAGATTALFIAKRGNSGNVGIGTTSPAGRLDVDGAAQTVTAVTQRAIINNTNAITTNTEAATAVYGLTIDEPNITVGTFTPTNSASVYVSGAATEATNNYALWVDAGTSRFDGAVSVGSQATFVNSDATPDVSAGSHFITNTSAVTITDFDAGSGTLQSGHIIFVQSAGNITYDCTSSGLNCGPIIGGDIATTTGDFSSWIYNGTNWNLINWVDMATIQGGSDIAEMFPSQEELEPGNVVVVDVGYPVHVKKSTAAYERQLLGIISTQPGIILQDSSTPEESTYPVALVGRVPVKVSLENGPIEVGDPITSSSVPGVGMKATKAGPIVGKALESFDGQQCNNGTIEQCKITAFVNVSWFDPDIYLTSTGDLQIARVSSESAVQNDPLFAEIQNYSSKFKIVKEQTGEIISRIGSFAEVVVANLRAGEIRAQEVIVDGLLAARKITVDSLIITADSVDIAGQKLDDYIRTIVEDVVGGLAIEQSNNRTVISPLASIDRIHTNIISPLGSNQVEVAGNLNVDGSATVSGNLGAQSINADSLQINADATISGQLAADNLTANDASISGTLFADRIVANNIEGLEAKISTIAANYIKPVSGSSYLVSSESGTINLADILNTKYQILNTDFVDIQNLSADFGTFRDGLMALGPATFNQVTALESLSIATTMMLGPNSIDTLGETLEIQPLRQGAISFLAGAVRIETDGTLRVSGNAEFAGNVKVEGQLSAGIISPLPDRNLAIRLNAPDVSGTSDTFNTLRVETASGSSVLAINSRGDLAASGSGTFNKLNLSLAEPAYAISDTQALATGSAGTAIIKQYRSEITVRNPSVTEKSLIYITSLGDPDNQILYLMRQTPGISFTVGTSQPATRPLPFNFLIIN